MTKQVRIENADSSNHKVRVRAQELNADGEWVFMNDTYTQKLDYPTSMATTTIWKERRLIVEEYE